jgi:hypothetical protein
MKKEKIPGGLSKGKSLKDIAIMHVKSSIKGKPNEKEIEKMHDYLKLELKKGIKTELEHTTDKKIAREIAMDHIYEDPKYYTKLSKIEEMKNTKKINLNDLSKMVKKALNEEFVGGVNYDNVLAAELKQKVGNLDKLTPYVLELGDEIQSDSSGKIHVFDNGKKVKIFKDIDEFLRGIKYGPVKLSEENTSMAPHHDHEAKMAKAELRDMVKNAKEIYNMIKEGDQLPGWISAYITLASDYMHSVNEYMVEHNSGGEELNEENDDTPKKLTMDQFANWLGLPADKIQLAIEIVRMSDADGAYTHLQDMGEDDAAEAVEAIYFEYGSLKEAIASCKEDLGM